MRVARIAYDVRWDRTLLHERIRREIAFTGIEVKHAPAITLADDFKGEAVVDVDFQDGKLR